MHLRKKRKQQKLTFFLLIPQLPCKIVMGGFMNVSFLKMDSDLTEEICFLNFFPFAWRATFLWSHRRIILFTWTRTRNTKWSVRTAWEQSRLKPHTEMLLRKRKLNVKSGQKEKKTTTLLPLPLFPLLLTVTPFFPSTAKCSCQQGHKGQRNADSHTHRGYAQHAEYASGHRKIAHGSPGSWPTHSHHARKTEKKRKMKMKKEKKKRKKEIEKKKVWIPAM